MKGRTDIDGIAILSDIIRVCSRVIQTQGNKYAIARKMVWFRPYICEP